LDGKLLRQGQSSSGTVVFNLNGIFAIAVLATIGMDSI
jgi:hypothetical protein